MNSWASSTKHDCQLRTNDGNMCWFLDHSRVVVVVVGGGAVVDIVAVVFTKQKKIWSIQRLQDDPHIPISGSTSTAILSTSVLISVDAPPLSR